MRWCGVASTLLLLSLRGYYASLIDLGNMLRLMTSRNPLDFINYGNWCGLGGSGYPLDDLDRCCKIHDFCYDKASASVCLDEKPHVASYKWKYAAGKIHCRESVNSQFSPTNTKAIPQSVDKHDDPCGLSTCRCDGKFAACAQIHQTSYDSRRKRTRTPILNLLSNAFSRNKK